MEPEDRKSIEQLISQFIGYGWSDLEIIRFCRLTEECNPEMDETTALLRMSSLIEDVVQRTGIDFRKQKDVISNPST